MSDWLIFALCLISDAGLSHLFVTITSTWFSLHFGRHIGDHLPDIRRKVKPLPSLYRNLFCVFALLCWLAALLIFLLTSELTFRSGRRIALALTLAPPAAIIRWWLSWKLNRISPSWIRWGTWISNMSSTSIAATMTLLQVVTPLSSTLSLFQCQTLQAVQDGFCGVCLSTESSNTGSRFLTGIIHYTCDLGTSRNDTQQQQKMVEELGVSAIVSRLLYLN